MINSSLLKAFSKKSLPMLAALPFAIFLNNDVYANESQAIWYDDEKQALAIDPYFDGHGGAIYFDFNDDHVAAGVISQWGWSYLVGDKTSLGLYQKMSPYSTSWGWSPISLGNLKPTYNLSTNVTTLFYGYKTLDGFSYTTQEWNVVTGKTVIYVKPIINNQVIPVDSSILEDTYVKLQNDWQPISDLINMVEPIEPINVDFSISPGVINTKSKGKWVNAEISIEPEYLVNNIDIESIEITLSADINVEGVLHERVEIKRGVSFSEEDGSLTCKFDRQQIIDVLADNKTTVYLHGKLYDGTPIVGQTVLKVLSGPSKVK